MNGKIQDKYIILFIVGTLMLAFLPAATGIHEASASELVVLYSNDLRGETEPCG